MFSRPLREREKSYGREAGAVWEARASLSRRPFYRGATIAGLALALSAGLAACGGGARQDEDETEGTWKVDVISASFPGRQHLAEEAQLRIKVKNVDERSVPNLAVTVEGFGIRKETAQLSESTRPIWVVDEPPLNSTTAFTNTWAVGEVPSGETRTLDWKVAAVRSGTYTLRFRVAAGLDGKAKARLPDGSIPKGSFIARISDKPRKPKID